MDSDESKTQREAFEAAEKRLFDKWFTIAKSLIEDIDITSDVFNALKEAYSILESGDKWVNIGKQIESICASKSCPYNNGAKGGKRDIYLWICNPGIECCETCFNGGKGWILDGIEMNSRLKFANYISAFYEWLKKN